MRTWETLQDLAAEWKTFHNSELHALVNIWQEQRARLEKTDAFKRFLEKLRRRIAIEHGILERLYTIDRGITHLLIEHGYDLALIPHGSTSRPPSEIIAFLRDHETALERVFDFVAGQRELSTSFIKQLHQLLTRNQDTVDALDQFGKRFRTILIKGDWKKTPNNPLRGDGTMHEYCPPEQVASQMDMLIAWHLEHLQEKVSPEVEAAWLHHRFTQIHPFQDGNGRVARNLATLVFLRAGWFPLVLSQDVRDDYEIREEYIRALEAADSGDLTPLVKVFSAAQKRTFITVLSLSETVLAEVSSMRSISQAVVETLAQRQQSQLADRQQIVEGYADQLFTIAADSFARVEEEIKTAVDSHQLSLFIRTEVAASHNEKAPFYRYQIIETAKKLGYFANLTRYKSWMRLVLRVENLQTEILLSFHALGRDASHGVMVCSACAFRRYNDEDTGITENIEPLSLEPFTFTYLEQPTNLSQRFKPWIDQILQLGIAYWRKGIL